jgi:hypothetical protein
MIEPDAKSPVRWIVDSLMSLIECLHEGSSMESQVAVSVRGFARPADAFFGWLGETAAGYVIVSVSVVMTLWVVVPSFPTAPPAGFKEWHILFLSFGW